MKALYQEDWFTFRFADDRLISRFYLEGVEAGRRVSVFKIDPSTGERLGLLVTATVGGGGWVDLREPIIVRAGEAFVAVPGPSDPAAPGHGSATPLLTLLYVAGQFAVTLVGVLASLTGTVAAAGVGVFVVSAFDTDYLFGKDAEFEAAVEALRGTGHSVEGVLP